MKRFSQVSVMAAAAGSLTFAGFGAGSASAVTSVGTSTVLAGYQANLPTVITGSAAAGTDTFKMKVNVPTVRCPATRSTGLNEVFNVFGSSGAIFGDVFVICTSGTASYAADISGSGTYNSVDWNDGRLIGVSPGDRIIYMISSGTSTASGRVKDLTSGAAASFTGLPFAPTQIQIGDQPYYANGVPQPVPHFTAIHYSMLTYNGTPLGSLGPTGTSLVDSSANVQITTSGLNSAGNAFETTFTSSK